MLMADENSRFYTCFFCSDHRKPLAHDAPEILCRRIKYLICRQSRALLTPSPSRALYQLTVNLLLFLLLPYKHLVLEVNARRSFQPFPADYLMHHPEPMGRDESCSMIRQETPVPVRLTAPQCIYGRGSICWLDACLPAYV